MKMKLNRSIAITLFIFAPGCYASDNASQKNPDTLQSYEKKLEDDYMNSFAPIIFVNCTKKFADYQNIQLSKEFNTQYEQQKKRLEDIKDNLNKTLLKEGKQTEASQIKMFDEQHSFTLDKVTRGYCLNFKQEDTQDVFAKKVFSNLQHYQVPKEKDEVKINQENAVYLNSQYQLKNITFKLDQKNTPKVIILDNQAYPIQCSYQDVQQYDKALATHWPINDEAYDAAYDFYTKQSPQIDYILTCTSQKNLFENKITAISSTYPWYQPVLKGLYEYFAAGDALFYGNKNQIVIVLGHEPCVCNEYSEQECNMVKSASYGLKSHSWNIIDSLEKEKMKHNLQIQAGITSFASLVKDQLRKDYCYIDQDELSNHFINLQKQIKAEPIKQD